MSDYIDNGSFKFGNIDLFTEFGLRLINVIGDSLSPKLRERKVVIPNRSGAYDYGAKYYDEREVTLECASMVNLSRAEWRELSYILSKKIDYISSMNRINTTSAGSMIQQCWSR